MKELIPLAAMTAVVFGMKLLWPLTPTRGMFLVLQLAVYAIAGGAVYFVLAYFTGAVTDVSGAESIQKVLGKLKRS